MSKCDDVDLSAIPRADGYPVTPDYAELLEDVEEGAILYLGIDGDSHGTTRTHALVTDVSEGDATRRIQVQQAVDDTELWVEDGEVAVELNGRRKSWSDDPFRLTACEHYPVDIVEDLHVWEVHLCYNRAVESPSDETLTVYARKGEDAPSAEEHDDEAVALARRRSKNNPPNAAPVYCEQKVMHDA